MNLRRTLTGLLVVGTLLLSACGDDENSDPKKQFTFADEKISLKNANLYLVREDTYSDTHIYRDYFITDGEYNGEGGWYLESFTGATYYLAVELAVPNEEEFGPGEYPLFGSWSNQEDENANIGYVYFEMGEDEEYVELDLLSDADGEENVVVSGGVDDGDTMTLKFDGALTHYYFDGEDWVTDNESGKFYF
ncbi:MAG TPA: hypothetical protein VFM90_13235, partial [Cyclobacteriaceae bacterium]|nr:hypothetical protein [Cyclobacteriaceae bacterium]